MLLRLHVIGMMKIFQQISGSFIFSRESSIMLLRKLFKPFNLFIYGFRSKKMFVFWHNNNLLLTNLSVARRWNAIGLTYVRAASLLQLHFSPGPSQYRRNAIHVQSASVIPAAAKLTGALCLYGADDIPPGAEQIALGPDLRHRTCSLLSLQEAISVAVERPERHL